MSLKIYVYKYHLESLLNQRQLNLIHRFLMQQAYVEQEFTFLMSNLVAVSPQTTFWKKINISDNVFKNIMEKTTKYNDYVLPHLHLRGFRNTQERHNEV